MIYIKIISRIISNNIIKTNKKLGFIEENVNMKEYENCIPLRNTRNKEPK